MAALGDVVSLRFRLISCPLPVGRLAFLQFETAMLSAKPWANGCQALNRDYVTRPEFRVPDGIKPDHLRKSSSVLFCKIPGDCARRVQGSPTRSRQAPGGCGSTGMIWDDFCAEKQCKYSISQNFDVSEHVDAF